jgi:predicted O-methyltransferase YrrM
MSEIPGWFDWSDLYREAVSRANTGAYFVECGTFFGKSAAFLAREILASGKTIQFDSWDNWSGVPPEFGYPGWTGSETLTEHAVRQTLFGLPVCVRSGEALAAAIYYADASLDLVFLDDDHAADHVYAECRAWWPKVKLGGMLAGHDFDWPSVAEGVMHWANEIGVPTVGVACQRSWLVVKL